MGMTHFQVILGDFNAKVGKESIYKPTIGSESLRNETNNKGIKMIQFPISKGLNVRSTTFPHKDIHRDLVFSGRQDSEPNRSLWITGPDSNSCSHGTIPTCGDNTTWLSAPEDGRTNIRNMLSIK